MTFTFKMIGSFSMRKEGQGFPGGLAVKNPRANAGDTGSTPGPGFLGSN